MYNLIDEALAELESRAFKGTGGDIIRRIVRIYPTTFFNCRVPGTPTITLLAIRAGCLPPLNRQDIPRRETRPVTPGGRYTTLEQMAGFYAMRWAHRAACAAQREDWKRAETLIDKSERLLERAARLNVMVWRIMTGDVTWEFSRKRAGDDRWRHLITIPGGTAETATRRARAALDLMESIEGVRVRIRWDAPPVGQSVAALVTD